MSTPSPQMSAKSWAMLLLLALLWGTSFLTIRLALDGIGPSAVVLVRTAGAALILWGVVAVMRVPVPRDPKQWLGLAGIGLLNCAMPFGLISWGQQFIPSALASILNASTAVFGVAVAALFFRDERLTPRRVSGLIIGFLGVVIAIGPDAIRGLSLTSLGQFALIAATLCYAFGSAVTRIIARDINPITAAAGMMTTAALWMLPVTLFIEGPPSAAALGGVAFSLAWLVVMCTAAAYLLYFRLIAVAGAGNTMLVTLLTPPVAIVSGALFLHERLTWNELAGFLTIALGLCIMSGLLKFRDGARRKG